MTLRTIAIDWSGAATGSADRIWLAEVQRNSVTRLESGRDRTKVAEFLIGEARSSPNLVVGIDFAFSLPGWYLRERGIASGPALWDVAATEGEAWLRDCSPPFWGRPGRARPEMPEQLRRTDREVPSVAGIRPKSVFQIGGAGAVGTGSIRGMPLLKQLRESGFAIWPFDPSRAPMVVEIYPRLLTGAVVKSSEDQRQRYLQDRFPELDPAITEKATRSEDAFDALVSAFAMADASSDFESLPTAHDPDSLLEGKIWLPRGIEKPQKVVKRGRFNSSKTRVAPVFAALRMATQEDPQWIKRLLDLVVGGSTGSGQWRNQDLRVIEIHHEPEERALRPPVALLSWLIRHFKGAAAKLTGNDDTSTERRKLLDGDADTISRALGRLREGAVDRGWHVLEGHTYPDVYVVTTDAVIVIEGKRTEAGATTSTSWMAGRNQMLRHIDAAWEIRGHRSVYGFFVVEGEDGTGVPAKWVHASVNTISSDSLRNSLPHRSVEEQAQIASCFLGATTWQAIVSGFGLDPILLEEGRVGGLGEQTAPSAVPASD
jgi:hypothetical protein